MKKSPDNSKIRPKDKETKPLSAGQQWLFRLTAMVFVPLFLILGVEILLRLAGYGFDTELFKEIEIGNSRFLVNNDKFGLRFFPPQLERFTSPIRMAAKKPADTCRIFILGESAAMGDPEPAYGAARYMEVLLSMRYPKTRFEIVNTGITAINSHVILPIARDCARREGDIWIIYMGNNEMVGPFGAATVFGAKTPPLGVIRLNLAIQKTRLGQLLISLVRKSKGSGSAPSWGGMEMFAENKLGMNDPRREAVFQNFSKNLDDILDTGLKSGAKIMLNTVAVNLRDCAPFASLGNTNLKTESRKQFDKLFQEGLRSQSNGDVASASKDFEAASQLDPTFAEVQYNLGRCLLGSGDSGSASNHLQLACDDDALPFRADSRINQIIRDKEKHANGRSLILFDASRALGAGEMGGVCGSETFYEHVHYDFEGSYRLGFAWADQISRLMSPSQTSSAASAWASREICEKRLGLSDWNNTLVLQHMIGRMQQPPLGTQSGNKERMNALEKRVDALHALETPEAAVKARKSFEEVLQQQPDDFLLRENFALFLQLTGDLSEAATQSRKVQQLLPEDSIASFQLGKILVKQGLWEEAESFLRKSIHIHRSFPEGWQELGNALAGGGKYEEALGVYKEAAGLRPQDPQNHFQSARALSKLGRHAEAIEAYRSSIRLDASNWQTHFELGGELDALSQLEPAKSEFGQAVRLNPNNSRTHFNYGVLLAKQGQMEEARREFEITLKLEPGYEKARIFLQQVNAMETRKP